MSTQEMTTCPRCNGEGVRHTGIDECPTTICNLCNGAGEITAIEAALRAAAVRPPLFSKDPTNIQY